MYFTGAGGGIVDSASQLIPLNTDAVLQSYDVQAHVEEAAEGVCTVDADQNLRVKLAINAPANALCFFDAQIRGVKVP